MADTILLDVNAARDLINAYRYAANSIGWNERELGDALTDPAAITVVDQGALVTTRLRALSEMLRDDADDLAWRVGYVAAHGAVGRPLLLPDRPHELRSIFALVAAAADSDADLEAVLAELAFHVVTDPSSAQTIAAAFHAHGLHELQRRIEHELAVAMAEVVHIDQINYDSEGRRRDIEGLATRADALLEPLGILLAGLSHDPYGRQAVLDSWSYDDPDAALSLMGLAFSAGTWNDELLLRVASDVFSGTDQRDAFGRAMVLGQEYLAEVVWPELLDPQSMVLRALGRNPEAARAWIADHDGVWTVLDDSPTDWNIRDGNGIVRQARFRDEGFAALLRGAMVDAPPRFLADQLVGSLRPDDTDRANDGVFYAVGEHDIPGPLSAAALADMISVVWPLLTPPDRADAVPDTLAGPALSRIMAHDEGLARLLAGFSMHLEATFTAAYTPDIWGAADPQAFDDAMQSAFHGFELLDEGLDGVDLGGDQLSLARSAFSALLGYGAKTGLRAIGAGAGLPGVILGWGAGELVGFVAGTVFPSPNRESMSSQQLLEELFVGGGGLPGGTERLPSPGQVLLANAAMTANPLWVPLLGDSRFLSGTTIVLPDGAAELEAFGDWFHSTFEDHSKLGPLIFDTSMQLADDAATVAAKR